MHQLMLLLLLIVSLTKVTEAYPVSPRKSAITKTADYDRNMLGLNSNEPPSLIEDDGFSITNKKNPVRKWFADTFLTAKQPGNLILVRHGETVMNYNKTFTGWIDTDISERGVKEIEHAANLLIERGYKVDVTYTSRLKRAIRSSWIMLIGLNQIYKPVYKSWRLNERMYGDLEGKSKPQIAREWGEEVVQEFRSGLKGRPPPMQANHPNWHQNERKYSDLKPWEIPVTESLEDTMQRTIPLWNARILPALRSGKNVLIVAHANSLRGILKHIDNISEEDISKVAIPNGIPLVYKFDRRMRPIKQGGAESPLSGEFLEKKGLLRQALDREKTLRSFVPGLYEEVDEAVREDNINSLQPKSQFDAVLQGLQKLNEKRELMTSDVNASVAGTWPVDGINVPKGWSRVNNSIGGYSSATARTTPVPPPVPFNAPYTPKVITVPDIKSNEEREAIAGLELEEQLLQQQLQREQDINSVMMKLSDTVTSSSPREPKDQVIVLIRHGKTAYNKLGIFTGWEDAPLIDSGRAEARAAGRLLKLHGFEFDAVYTSWLSRAIETAWLVLDEMDSLWLPISKSWRLNERMYGALTGMSKAMIKETYGEAQFNKWRRSYATRPPPLSSFSGVYPGNDERYVNNRVDIRYSVFESLIRSISHRRVELHRKFPKTESLKDCMSRTVPYFKQVIYPRSIAQGKSVLISSSENAIRGLLMYLCNVPADRINEVEIPTGLPLVFNWEKKCIQLLDDGRENPLDLLEKYDFGKSPELLFKPCNLDDRSNEDVECFINVDNGRSYAYDPILRLPIAATVKRQEEREAAAVAAAEASCK